VEDGVIFEHLAELSDGKINLTQEKETLSESKSLLRNKSKGNTGKKNQKNQKSKNWKRR